MVGMDQPVPELLCSSSFLPWRELLWQLPFKAEGKVLSGLLEPTGWGLKLESSFRLEFASD
jgi:hypothetical protein